MSNVKAELEDRQAAFTSIVGRIVVYSNKVLLPKWQYDRIQPLAYYVQVLPCGTVENATTQTIQMNISPACPARTCQNTDCTNVAFNKHSAMLGTVTGCKHCDALDSPDGVTTHIDCTNLKNHQHPTTPSIPAQMSLLSIGHYIKGSTSPLSSCPFDVPNSATSTLSPSPQGMTIGVFSGISPHVAQPATLNPAILEKEPITIYLIENDKSSSSITQNEILRLSIVAYPSSKALSGTSGYALDAKSNVLDPRLALTHLPHLQTFEGHPRSLGDENIVKFAILQRDLEALKACHKSKFPNLYHDSYVIDSLKLHGVLPRRLERFHFDRDAVNNIQFQEEFKSTSSYLAITDIPYVACRDAREMPLSFQQLEFHQKNEIIYNRIRDDGISKGELSMPSYSPVAFVPEDIEGQLQLALLARKDAETKSLEEQIVAGREVQRLSVAAHQASELRNRKKEKRNRENLSKTTDDLNELEDELDDLDKEFGPARKKSRMESQLDKSNDLPHDSLSTGFKKLPLSADSQLLQPTNVKAYLDHQLQLLSQDIIIINNIGVESASLILELAEPLSESLDELLSNITRLVSSSFISVSVSDALQAWTTISNLNTKSAWISIGRIQNQMVDTLSVLGADVIEAQDECVMDWLLKYWDTPEGSADVEVPDSVLCSIFNPGSGSLPTIFISPKSASRSITLPEGVDSFRNYKFQPQVYQKQVNLTLKSILKALFQTAVTSATSGKDKTDISALSLKYASLLFDIYVLFGSNLSVFRLPILTDLLLTPSTFLKSFSINSNAVTTTFSNSLITLLKPFATEELIQCLRTSHSELLEIYTEDFDLVDLPVIRSLSRVLNPAILENLSINNNMDITDDHESTDSDESDNNGASSGSRSKKKSEQKQKGPSTAKDAASRLRAKMPGLVQEARDKGVYGLHQFKEYLMFLQVCGDVYRPVNSKDRFISSYSKDVVLYQSSAEPQNGSTPYAWKSPNPAASNLDTRKYTYNDPCGTNPSRLEGPSVRKMRAIILNEISQDQSSNANLFRQVVFNLIVFRYLHYKELHLVEWFEDYSTLIAFRNQIEDEDDSKPPAERRRMTHNLPYGPAEPGIYVEQLQRLGVILERAIENKDFGPDKTWRSGYDFWTSVSKPKKPSPKVEGGGENPLYAYYTDDLISPVKNCVKPTSDSQNKKTKPILCRLHSTKHGGNDMVAGKQHNKGHYEPYLPTFPTGARVVKFGGLRIFQVMNDLASLGFCQPATLKDVMDFISHKEQFTKGGAAGTRMLSGKPELEGAAIGLEFAIIFNKLQDYISNHSAEGDDVKLLLRYELNTPIGLEHTLCKISKLYKAGLYTKLVDPNPLLFSALKNIVR